MNTMDPSEIACVEILRPKTVPEGLIALATIVHINDVHIKLQITGGLICLVELYNVNRIYTSLLEEQHNNYNDNNKPPSLSHMFKVGQQYVCKIIEKRGRKGYTDAQDIIATLDPSSIQEDCLPKTLLSIPHVPIQCVIQSVEDHGYQMDIGFKGLTGFLSFSDSCKEKLTVGQVVRCCLKTPISADNTLRVVNLSMTEESMKLSRFSIEKANENVITENCILPGSRSFLTVMKVLKNGLIVNFMNEFAGFVNTFHLQNDWQTLENFTISDQLNCTVLYYNKLTKTFCLSLRKNSQYRETLEHFIRNYHTGQFIKKARVVRIEGTRSIVFKLDNKYKAIANIKDALQEDTATMTRDEILNTLETNFTDNSHHKCRIKSLNLADLIVVISLREEFLNLPYVSVDEMKPGDFVKASIKKYVKDGIIVSFGLNLRAMILNTHLQDYVTTHSYKKYPVGKVIESRVLKIDFGKQPPRVYLTNQQELMDPNMLKIDSIDRNFKGKTTNAIVIKVKSNGLIVELFNNTKGFIPSRFLSTAKVAKLDDIFQVGQVISCVVYSVNPARQSILLGVIPIEKIMEAKKAKIEAKKKRKEMKKLGKFDAKSLNQPVPKGDKRSRQQSEISSSDSDVSENDSQDSDRDQENLEAPLKKSRRQRSEEAKQRENNLREAERRLIDRDTSPKSIMDFERLVLKTPNSSDAWIKYSKFMIDNIETEKARLICRRALRTIQFREEKEKLKVWLYLIKIEAKFGGIEKVRSTIKDAEQTTDKLSLYRGASKVLISCNEIQEACNLHNLLIKLDAKSTETWLNYITFVMEHKKDLKEARDLYAKACKVFSKADLVNLKSRFAQLEFRLGDVERGKTLFESLLSENPKRVDLWTVYKAMIEKFGERQMDGQEVAEQNEQIIRRITESLELVSKKRKNVKADQNK